jgi:endoglucanase
LTENTQNVSADLSDFNNAQYQTTDGDDRIWAAAEMWETTGDEAALADFETRIQNQASTGGGQSALFEVQWDWPNLKNMGVHTYLKSTRPGRDSQLVQTLEEAVVSAADEIVDTGENGVEGYGRAYENYYWGSNGVVARSTLTLKHAYDISGDTKYLDACMNQIANLTGRNQYGRSYITGVGFHPPENPHDRRSGASGHAYPGYLVGGGSTIDNYEDVEENYEVNEIAINWQGAMAYALALFLSPAAADADTDTDTDTNSDTAADIGTNMITATSGGCSCAAPGGTLHEPSSIFALTMLAFE